MNSASTAATATADRLQPGDLAPPFERRPVFGLPLRVPDGSHPQVLLFIRQLGDPFARQTVAEVQERYADFDREGIRLATITQTDLLAARDFVPRYHVLCPMVTDPDGELQQLYAIEQDRWLTQSLRAMLKSSPSRLKDALNRGVGKPSGPARQLSAEFVIDREGRLAHSRYAGSITSGPDLDQLLQIAKSL
jgi:peroxiredoxin